jgi:hypothetical protein
MYSKGISWIDDCRIPFVSDEDKGSAKPQGKTLKHKGWDTNKWLQETIEPHSRGRFPANLLVSDDMLNDGVISKSVKGRNDIGSSTYGGNSLLHSKTKMNNTDRGFNDKGTNSRYYDIDKWFEKLLND